LGEALATDSISVSEWAAEWLSVLLLMWPWPWQLQSQRRWRLQSQSQ
jgi:hypothetical protein